MANPLIIECPEGTWVKALTGVTKGTIHVLNKNPDKYMQTYRPTGGIAPIDTIEGVSFEDRLEVINSFPIDVYIEAIGELGKVRVDAWIK